MADDRSMLALGLLALALVLTLVWLAETVAQDGYGRRPLPASRQDWGQATMPSSPFPAQLLR